MKRLLTPVLVACLGAVMLAGSATAAPTTSAVYLLEFTSPTDTFTFALTKAQGAGRLTVETADCCVHPDFWRATISTARPSSAGEDVTGLGSGQGFFSGAVTAHPFVAGSVTISYDHGVDIFSAGMCVRFTYSKQPGVEIAAPPGATLLTDASFVVAYCM